MIKIIPAILARDAAGIEEKIRFLESIPEIDEAQLDFSDGDFAPNTTALPSEINALDTRLYLEAHLMVREPQRYFHDLELLGARTVLLHYESYHAVEFLLTAVRNLKALGMAAGVAVNPQTDIAVFDRIAPEIDMALILGVLPGFQGQKFLPETLERVAHLRRAQPTLLIEVDGGVNVENLGAIVAHGADRVVVGSAIWQTSDPKKTIESFLKKIN